MSHRTGAPLEHGGGGGTEVLAVCHPTLALGRSSKHAMHRASRAARSARRLRHPNNPKRQHAQFIGGQHMQAPGRAGLRRRTRSAWQRFGCPRRPRAQRLRHRRRARSARRRSQPAAARPAHRRGLVAPGRAGFQGPEPLGGPAQRLAPGRAGVQGRSPLVSFPVEAHRKSLRRGEVACVAHRVPSRLSRRRGSRPDLKH